MTARKDMPQFKDVAIEASKKAGKILMDNFEKKKQVHRKEARELVTNVDVESEGVIVKTIRDNFPSHKLESEELGREKYTAEDYVWIVDPLDGTHNYAYGVPFFSTSIALARDGQLILGAIYDPVHDKMFYAERTKGAFVNGEPIHVSGRSRLSDALVMYDNQFHKRKDMFPNLQRLYTKILTVRISGSAATDACLVASGIADARIWHKTKIVDIAAGVVIVKEAGGKATDFKGDPLLLGGTEVVVSNGKILPELVAALKT
jgi:myo-inositol-1(or 4)-monophosphatase